MCDVGWVGSVLYTFLRRSTSRFFRSASLLTASLMQIPATDLSRHGEAKPAPSIVPTRSSLSIYLYINPFLSSSSSSSLCRECRKTGA